MCACMQNSERASNLLIGALKPFPMEYMFNLVYKLDQVSVLHPHGHLTLRMA